MGKTIEKRVFPGMNMPKKKRVAAYARVSSGKDAMLHSLSAQISAYSSLIQKTPGWQFVKVYADEAVTGTKDSRAGFRQLLEDCRAGRIDMVLCKSISRFARNTVTLLETVRELKDLGVDVYFEEQNIHTLSGDGELMLTILASYAQEESLSVSENMKWRIRKNFEEGKPWNATMLGYRDREGVLSVVPEEAEIVRRIYREYLSGAGLTIIANGLEKDGLRPRYGGHWTKNSISRILHNEAYTGNLLLQKTYRENCLTKKTFINNGELPQYRAEGTHEAIVSVADFEAAQAEMEKRSRRYAPKGKDYNARYPYSGLIVCGYCGKKYWRKVTHGGPVWICSTYNSKGKAACPSKQIPESVLDELTADLPLRDLTAVRAERDNTLVFIYPDGHESVKRWRDRSRAESWTPKMKEYARERELQRLEGNENGNS